MNPIRRFSCSGENDQGTQTTLQETCTICYQMDAATTARLKDVWSDVWPGLQVELVELSTNTDWRVIEGASHYIPLEAPKAIAVAVRDVVTAQRENTLVRHAKR
ncbi:MAG: hypothetical protein AAFQ95_11965 [Cyanobacteria bacterium J06621_3]